MNRIAFFLVDPTNAPSCVNADGSTCAATFSNSGIPDKMGCRLPIVDDQVPAAKGGLK
ncbi:MAG: hypothetical protein WCC92_19045 [Candidatus Korobacteraceae bacterium]